MKFLNKILPCFHKWKPSIGTDYEITYMGMGAILYFKYSYKFCQKCGKKTERLYDIFHISKKEYDEINLKNSRKHKLNKINLF